MNILNLKRYSIFLELKVGRNNRMTYDLDYFYHRKLEDRFFHDLNVWLDWFGKDTTFCFLGCGFFHRGFAADYYGVRDFAGCDFSWPILNTPYKHLKNKLKVGDVSKRNLVETFGRTFDMVVAYDLLEHMNTIEEVETALENAYELSNKWLLVSVPVLGDPNLEADSSHIIKKSMEWWLWKIRCSGFNIIEVPKHFPYFHQLILAEVIKNE